MDVESEAVRGTANKSVDCFEFIVMVAGTEDLGMRRERKLQIYSHSTLDTLSSSLFSR